LPRAHRAPTDPDIHDVERYNCNRRSHFRNRKVTVLEDISNHRSCHTTQRGTTPHHLQEDLMVTLEHARRIIAAAELKAKELKQPMNIAVADGGGNLIAHVRMDEAWIGSIDISIKKAFTARAFDISTKELGKNSQSGDQFFGIHASNDGRVMIFAGGIPLTRAGKVVGAVGVSGGSGEQDHAVAEAGAKVFE
jgi:uncharacterized protein GlcG (DUF336 family)